MPNTAPTHSIGFLPKLLTALLAVGMGVQLAQLSLRLPVFHVASNDSSALSNTPTQTDQTTSAAPLPSLSDAINSASLFGPYQEQAKAPEAAPTPKVTPKTRLNLELLGVIDASIANRSIAIIKVGSEENIFSIGQIIAAGATLTEVHADHVLINNGGQLEQLALPENAVPISTSSPASNTQSSGQETLVSNGYSAASLPTNPRELRDYLVQNPNTIGELMSISPYRNNGQTIGYAIQPRAGAQLLSQFGLSGGDVITRINGIELSSQRRGLNALRRLISADSVELTVLRNGTEIPISISLQ